MFRGGNLNYHADDANLSYELGSSYFRKLKKLHLPVYTPKSAMPTLNNVSSLMIMDMKERVQC